LGLAYAESDSNQLRSPGGVLAPQSQGRLTDLRRVGVRQPRGDAIVGANRLFTPIVESLQQVADGAHRQAELAGEVGRRLSSLSQLQ
jgi:hypothetical protein